ncbi:MULTISPECIES: SHOCT domain-containing protein [Bacillaceae]|uniref:SHOCT domain-containing protein n=1 Tax=Bacillaceae TaxID=186817 RepID=UPI001145989B|nr:MULTISPECIES: SHOCT domain-containing protein [Bacillaceae]MCM3164100.1 SHOCT domain-containing protein [Metabacillus litoralis]UGB33498.1 SHOCT domain-containing protein [Metabacillus sp. B2-18]
MSCCGSSNISKNQNKNTSNANLTPIEQLKVRLAQGEISIEEYLKTKTVLDQ